MSLVLKMSANSKTFPIHPDLEHPTWLDRFTEKIEIAGRDECWLWTSATMSESYGCMRVQGRQRYAHRLAWQLANGREIPAGLVVRHRCDNSRCVNPRHLLVGTNADNMLDAVERGQHSNGGKLTAKSAAKIRQLVALGMRQRAVAAIFNISHGMVRHIVTGRCWPEKVAA